MIRDRYQDDDKSQMISVASRNCPIVISSLKTFSCESDTELVDSFDSSSYFSIDIENRMIETRSLSKREKVDSEQHQQDGPRIVTPQKPCTTAMDISLDPLSESQIHPLLLLIDSDERMDPTEKGERLLFPSADQGRQAGIHSKYNTCLASARNCRHHCNHPNTKLKKESFNMSSMCNTLVYNQLLPFLPLPESFEPILCLLLQMEFSSTIHRSILNQACQIVNDQWKHEVCKGCSVRNGKKKDLQNISGKIVDQLVENLGLIVDLPALFQSSAHASIVFNAPEDNRLSIFFQRQKNTSVTGKIGSQLVDGMALDLYATDLSIYCERLAGQKRKSRSCDNAEDDEISFENFAQLEPTILELAVAYGASYSTIDEGRFRQGQMSLDEFVKKTSRHLQHMGTVEKRKLWNNMKQAWHYR